AARTLSGSKPLAASFAPSSIEQNSRRASSVTAAASAAAGSPACSLVARPLGCLFLNTHGWQQLQPDFLFDVVRNILVLLQVHARVVLALADTLAVVAVPGAGLVDDAVGRAQIDDLALTRDARAVHDLEFRLAERWRHFVLDHLDTSLVADHFLAVLDRANAADI